MADAADDDKIEPFGDTIPAVTKVMDLSKIETFKLRTVLLYRDRWPGELSVINPLSIMSGPADGAIGHGMVTIEEKRVIVDLFLRRDCPERLDIESGKKLYLGWRMAADGCGARIVALFIDPWTFDPYDPRLQPLGAPVF